MDTDLQHAMATFQRCVAQRDRQAAQVLVGDFALVLVAPVQAAMPRHRWLVLADYLVH